MTFDFFGEGRWIKAIGEDHAALVFSAIDGRPVVRFDCDRKPVVNDVYQGTSPSGRIMATLAYRGDGAFVHLWDVASLRPTSVTGPIFGVTGRTGDQAYLITDDLFIIYRSEIDASVFRSGRR
jgi:hypothetical protein